MQSPRLLRRRIAYGFDTRWDMRPARGAPVASFRSTVRQPVPDVGLTQASNVIPVVSSSEAASGMFTQPLAVNDSAAPVCPAVDHAAPFTRAPLLPEPEVSVVTVPLPS